MASSSNPHNLKSKLAARFGGGSVAQQAARQALASRSAKQQQHGMPLQDSSSSNKAPADDSFAACSGADGDMEEILGVMEALKKTNKVDSSPSCGNDVCSEEPDGSASPGSETNGPSLLSQQQQHLPVSPVATEAGNSSSGGTSSPNLRESRLHQKSAGNAQPNSAGSAASRQDGSHSSNSGRPAAAQQQQQQQQPQPLSFEAQSMEQLHKQQQQQPADTENDAFTEHHKQFYRDWKVKRHRPTSPDYKWSQGGAQGPMLPVKQAVFDFINAHPALAKTHYLRTPEQNIQLAQGRASPAHSPLRTSSSQSPAKQQQQRSKLRPKTAQPLSSSVGSSTAMFGSSSSDGNNRSHHANAAESSSSSRVAARRPRPHSAGRAWAGALAKARSDAAAAAAAAQGANNPTICRFSDQFGALPAGGFAKTYDAHHVSNATGLSSGPQASVDMGLPSAATAERDEGMQVFTMAQDAIVAAQQLSMRQSVHVAVTTAPAAAGGISADPERLRRLQQASRSKSQQKLQWQQEQQLQQQQHWQQPQQAPETDAVIAAVLQVLTKAQVQGTSAAIIPQVVAALGPLIEAGALPAGVVAMLGNSAAAAGSADVAAVGGAAAGQPSHDELHDVIITVNEAGDNLRPPQQQKQHPDTPHMLHKHKSNQRRKHRQERRHHHSSSGSSTDSSSSPVGKIGSSVIVSTSSDNASYGHNGDSANSEQSLSDVEGKVKRSYSRHNHHVQNTAAIAASPTTTSAAAGGASERELELQRARGAFDAGRFEQFNRQVDAEMARRAAAHDYGSDLEHSDDEHVHQTALRAADRETGAALQELAAAERQLQRLADEEANMQAAWDEQDEWMDAYRQHPGGSALDDARWVQMDNIGSQHSAVSRSNQGDDADSASASDTGSEAQQQRKLQHIAHLASGQRSRATAAAAAAERGYATADVISRAAAARGHQVAAAVNATDTLAAAAARPADTAAVGRAVRSVLSPADEQLSGPFMPWMSKEFPQYAAAKDAAAEQAHQQHSSGNAGSSSHPADWHAGEHHASGCVSEGPSSTYYGSRESRGRALLGPSSELRPAGTSGNWPNSDCSSGARLRARSVSPRYLVPECAHTDSDAGSGWEAHAAAKPKGIAAVKLEQDLALKAHEQEAHFRHRFTANPIPESTLEPRYQNIIADQAAKRAASHDRNLQLLAAHEAPFSFYKRDKEAAAAQAARRAAAKDPNRFQRQFKATPVPSHVHESRYQASVAGLQAARLAARVRAEMAREKAAAKLQESYKKRQELAAAAYRDRLQRSSNSPFGSPSWGLRAPPTAADGPPSQPRTTSAAAGDSEAEECQSAGGTGSPSKGFSAGRVPDFQALHAAWASRQAAIKAVNRRRVTVPEEFNVNGATPEEREARARKAARRKARILEAMQQDELTLTELRWPYKSSRAPVAPTPPPLLSPLPLSLAAASGASGNGGFGSNSGGGIGSSRQFVAGGTLAAHLRAETTRKARESGKFDSQKERESREWQAIKAEQQKRSQQRQAAQAADVRRKLEQQQQQQQPTGLSSNSPQTAAAASEAPADHHVNRYITADSSNDGDAAAAAEPVHVDAAMAEAAGGAAAAGKSKLSAAEMAAHLDKLLSGRTVARPTHQRPKSPGIASSTRVRASSMCSSLNSPAAAVVAARGVVDFSGSGSLPVCTRIDSPMVGKASRSMKNLEATLTQKRAGLLNRMDAPLMHIEARHAQAEKAAKEMVEDALLSQGIEAYRYVEG